MPNNSISPQADGENHHLIIAAIATELIAHGFSNHSFPNSKLLESLFKNLKISKSILLQYVNQPRINLISECAWQARFDFDQSILIPIRNSNKSGLDKITCFTQKIYQFFDECDSRILLFSAYFIDDFIISGQFCLAQKVYGHFCLFVNDLLNDFLSVEDTKNISSAYITALFSAGFDGDKDQFFIGIRNANNFLIDVVTKASGKAASLKKGLVDTLKAQIFKYKDIYGKGECIAIESFNQLSVSNQQVVDVIFFNLFGQSLSETIEVLD